MKTPSPKLVLLLLLTVCFTFSTVLQPKAVNWSAARGRGNSILAMAIGDTRQMLADQFLTEAQVYFHSGYYPSVFDEARAAEKNHLAENAHDHDNAGEEHESDFLSKRPHDWIEMFGRNFYVTEHTELSGVDTRELLPWLRLSAELNPSNPAPYLQAVFVLRKHAGKSPELLEFLREGLRSNPDSYEIMYELGRVFNEDFHDTQRAENLWEKALEKWEKTEGKETEPDVTTYREILTHLATSKEQAGNINEAINYLYLVKKLSPAPGEIQKQIDELRQKSSASTNAPLQSR